MKMFVCPNCNFSTESLAYPRSFKGTAGPCCGACGAMLTEREVTHEERQKLKAAHSGWTWRTVLGFEAILWAIVILIAVLFGSAEGWQ